MNRCACAVFSVLLLFGNDIISGAQGGYVVNPSDGRGYRLVYQAQSWQVAKQRCLEEGAKLAVPKTQDEFSFIQRMVRAMHYPSIVGAKDKLVVWLGVSNLHDYREWENVDGENIDDTGFHTWAQHEYDGHLYGEDLEQPHCAAMDAANPGLRTWWCHRRQPYICEKHANYID